MAMLRAIQALMAAGRNDEAEQIMRDLYKLELSEQMQSMPPTQETAPPQSPPGGGI